jgi:hypothetical protein
VMRVAMPSASVTGARRNVTWSASTRAAWQDRCALPRDAPKAISAAAHASRTIRTAIAADRTGSATA